MVAVKIKTSELTGRALNWAVAKALYGNRLVHYRTWLENTNEYWKGTDCSFAPTGEHRILSEDFDGVTTQFVKDYSTDWSQGGPIIEREIESLYEHTPLGCWAAKSKQGDLRYGSTPLIAALRCYVASKLGDEVEIPEELL